MASTQDSERANPEPLSNPISPPKCDSGLETKKKLILCCDGTWLNRSKTQGSRERSRLRTPSNVTRLIHAMNKIDEDWQQIVYYQTGIGSKSKYFDHLLRGATGFGISENIREAYSFLISNYRSSSERHSTRNDNSIFLIGFSRGAYTARSIAGLVCAIGILRVEALPFFSEIYADLNNCGNKDYEPQFLNTYLTEKRLQTLEDDETGSRDRVKRRHNKLKIDFPGPEKYIKRYRKILFDCHLTRFATIAAIAVFDTVETLAVPVYGQPRSSMNRLLSPIISQQVKWFGTGLEDRVDNAYHALALDERRLFYQPTLFSKPKCGKTNLQQVWFRGAHNDIGGGNKDSRLANATLLWMMDQLAGNSLSHRADDRSDKQQNKIKFHKDFLSSYTQFHEDLIKPYFRDDEYYSSWSHGTVSPYWELPLTLSSRKPKRHWQAEADDGTEEQKSETNETIHFSVRLRHDYWQRQENNKSSQNNIQSSLSKIFSVLTRRQRPRNPESQTSALRGWELKKAEDPADAGDGDQQNARTENEDEAQDKNVRHWWSKGPGLTIDESQGPMTYESLLCEQEAFHVESEVL